MKYLDRAELCRNKTAKSLLQIMEKKQTNLGVALDCVSSQELLNLAQRLGPEICLLKTHIDILEDFNWQVIEQLRALSDQHQFLLFEDRKFADIGNTVLRQYEGGIYRIAEWADITNAHILPGPGIIEALQRVGLQRNRGLLLLAEMSSEGTLTDKTYREKTLAWAREYPDFVIGFITQRKLCHDPNFLHMTPGVHLETGRDGLGQQYRSPEQVIGESFCDVMLVGRAITAATHPEAVASVFRKRGFDAYRARLKFPEPRLDHGRLTP